MIGIYCDINDTLRIRRNPTGENDDMRYDDMNDDMIGVFVLCVMCVNVVCEEPNMCDVFACA